MCILLVECCKLFNSNARNKKHKISIRPLKYFRQNYNLISCNSVVSKPTGRLAATRSVTKCCRLHWHSLFHLSRNRWSDESLIFRFCTSLSMKVNNTPEQLRSLFWQYGQMCCLPILEDGIKFMFLLIWFAKWSILLL